MRFWQSPHPQWTGCGESSHLPTVSTHRQGTIEALILVKGKVLTIVTSDEIPAAASEVMVAVLLCTLSHQIVRGKWQKK